MNEKEMRELDAWIAENVMGWELAGRRAMGWVDGPDVWITKNEDSPTWQDFTPTIDQTAAMEVLKKCADQTPRIHISTLEKHWIVGSQQPKNPAKAETLELAICLFAKRLFEPARQTASAKIV